VSPNYKKERELYKLGFKFICGIDEAGRGAIAGPLVSGAVILKPKTKPLFDDSKRLSRSERQKLFKYIKENALSFAVGIASINEIINYGIQSATYLSYKRAIEELSQNPDFLLIDHYRLPGSEIPQFPITKGDQISQSIAAASIVAKVTRDEMMMELDREYQSYDFCNNCGYGTKNHFEVISKIGICKVHRTNFIDKPGTNQLNFK
jgi:ribonuclease HII